MREMRILKGELSSVDNISGSLIGGSQLSGELSKINFNITGRISSAEQIQGSLSTTEVIKDPYYEVDNNYGTTIYIGE